MAAALLPMAAFVVPASAGKSTTPTLGVLDYAQCQNEGAPSTSLACRQWGNGILNASNSHYSEDQVTPQRLVVSATAGATGQKITLRYMTRKGSANAHAYDYLATWNHTQTAANACQGLKSCPGGPVSKFPMKSDPAVVEPSANNVSNRTDAHELPPGSREFWMYGGTITATSIPVHVADSSDSSDYAKVTVTFTATSSKVMLLFGGHLAASTGDRGWGEGLGASNISGGPYHIILDGLNDASGGGRDNQIMASAILPGSPDFTVTKTATPALATPGQTVTYAVKVTNNGTVAGATTWDDDFDDRLTPSQATTSDGPNCSASTVNGNKLFDDCATGLISPEGSKTWTYTAKMPTTFGAGSGTGGCDSGQFPVLNTVTLATGSTDDARVCVSAAADLRVTKSASPSTATPGQTVTYTIRVENHGDADGSTTWDDDFDDRLSPSTATTSGGPNCEPGATKFDDCATGTIQPGVANARTWTYTAKMPTTFTGTPGTGCEPGGPQLFPVRNVVVLASGGEAEKTVCVNPTPAFTVEKSASPTSATPGQLVTYKIRVENTGSGPGSTTFDDDFDNRLTPTTASTPGGPDCAATTVNGNKLFDDCATGTIQPGAANARTWTYTATMPTTFTGSPGGNGCNATPGANQQYPVRNVVVLATGATDDAVVCVTAAPDLQVTKTANPSVANPGDPVTYTIRVENFGAGAGSTTWDDDFDNRLTPSQATTPGGPNCTATTVNANKLFDDCATGTIQPGAANARTWTYTATMPETFSGSPGGNGCPAGPTPPGQYPVRNVVVLSSGDTDDAVVCVNAQPTFTVTKTVSPTNATPGQQVTYLIKVTNGGSAAGSTTFDDDFDNRLTPSQATTPGGPNCTATTVNGNKLFDDCATGTIQPGAANARTWTYTATMPTTFTGAPGGDGCNGTAGPSQEYPVRNVVVLATGATDDAVVCVNAAPDLRVTKTASPATATAGQQVTYTVRVENFGAAPGSTTWDDDFDNRLTPSQATTPGGPNCTATTVNGNKLFDDCATGTIQPGAANARTWTYTATMPTSFTGAPGGNGCTATQGPNQQYPVRNVVVLATGSNDDAVVCVSAKPALSLVKTVTVTNDDLGRQVLTYKLTYTNSGNAEAPSATITEAIPGGTTYDDCSNACQGSPGGPITWTVGPVAPHGGTGFVTLTVVVTSTTACQVTNTATIAAAGFTSVSSNTLVTPVTPAPDPDGAHTSASSFGAKVTTGGLLNLTTSTLSDSSTAQSGVGGPTFDSESLVSASVPALLEADALRTTSRSVVTQSPAAASSTATSEVAKLCLVRILLTCTVESSTVRAVARADASGSGATFSANGSAIEDLKIVGVATPVDLTQTTTIPLAALVFGPGSYVAINERSGGTSLSGGSYRSDLEVTMIRVHITGALGVQAADISVAHAEAHADFPELVHCGDQANRSVSGHAFIADAAVLPPLVLATQGYVAIPPTGGSAHQEVAGVNLVNGNLTTTGVAGTDSVGSITGTRSAATSHASAANVCLLRFPASTQCVVMATAVRSVATAQADGTSASSRDIVSSTDFTELVGLQVRTSPGGPLIPIDANVRPNTTINLLGIGVLILNEQLCDNGAPLSASSQPRCSGTGHTGLTVRALHLVLLRQFGSFSPGVELVVAEAHADATWS